MNKDISCKYQSKDSWSGHIHIRQSRFQSKGYCQAQREKIYNNKRSQFIKNKIQYKNVSRFLNCTKSTCKIYHVNHFKCTG